jgi:signal transduction histidine kinase
MVESDDLEPPSIGAPTLRLELQERNKELRFLHHAAHLLNMRGEPRDILRAVLELLPSAMCYPEWAGARLELGPLEITTSGHEPSEWCLRADFEVDGVRNGCVEVCYSQAPTTGPVFLDEEQSLLASFAQLLKGWFERASAEEAYERLLRVEAAQQAAISENRDKDDFLGTVSHELRSSLHVMLGWIQVLQQGAPDPEVTARGLKILERNVALQAKLIEDLMDHSRIISGKLELDMARVDLADLVSFAVDASRPAAGAKNVELVARVKSVGAVMADQQRLQQVLDNVLRNAVRFTPAGGRIQVDLERQGSTATLRVADNGVGIEAELLPHIFERVRHGDATKKGRGTGLRLGLPIAHHLVELHGGTLTVQSAPPAPGTTFTIVLPLIPAARA